MIHPRIIDKPLGAIVSKIPDRFHGLMLFVSIVFSPLFLGIFLAIILCVSLWIDNDQMRYAAAITFLLLPLAELCKLITKRSRPETLYAQNMRLKTYSFPSGHAYVSALVFGFLAVAAITGLSYGIFLAAVFVMIAALVGVSRVYLGAHFPSDVVAGWLMGSAAQYIIWLKGGLS